MFEIVKAFLEDVHTAQSIPALEELLQPVLDYYEIKHFICTNMYGLSCIPDRHPMFGCWDTDWVNHYVSNGYYMEDAVMHYCKGLEHDGRPYFWSELLSEKELTKMQSRVFAEAWDAELRDGLVIPLSIQEGELAMLTLGGPNFQPNPVVQGILHTIAIQAHRQARMILKATYNGIPSHEGHPAVPIPDISQITKVERSVISLLSDDKRARDIAAITNTSVSTVRKHLTSAKLKLNVDNTEALVAKALRYKLIK